MQVVSQRRQLVTRHHRFDRLRPKPHITEQTQLCIKHFRQNVQQEDVHNQGRLNDLGCLVLEVLAAKSRCMDIFATFI